MRGVYLYPAAPVLALLLAVPLRAEDAISFDKQVAPVLEARCAKCHGASMQMGKLDLTSREAALKGGEKGPAILPGSAEKSTLFRRVARLEKPYMPMDGRLTDSEIDVIKKWIDQGAAWGQQVSGGGAMPDLSALEHYKVPDGAKQQWAFRKPVQAPVPAGESHPVDAFLKRTWDAKGLTPAPQASKETLLRRAYLDLTGLPPAPAEARAFLDDNSAGAWEKLIDRLLESPRYGERWGRHWLDVARYADSNGYEHDFDRPHAWRYRDYVIAAFNKDTPFNRFLEEQLAGDELDEVTTETLIATGFLRNYAKVGFREKDNPQFRYDYLDDMIATVGRGVLGLTVQCARCHNHKFDPVGQADYYRLQASLWGYVEVEHPLVPRDQAAAYEAGNRRVDEAVKPLKAEVDQMEKPYRDQLLAEKYKKWPAHIQKAVFTPEDQRTPGETLLANQIIRTTRVTGREVERLMPAAEVERKRAVEARIAALEKSRPASIPVAMGITDGDYRFTPDGAGDEPAPGKGVKQEVTEGSFLSDGSKPYVAPPSYFLHGGDMGSRGSETKPGFISVLDNGKYPAAVPPANHRTSGRRLALARWLGSADNPLTSRVIVNRIWHHHFGRGIVTTLDNFGKTGEPPTHPELLDWLAVEFQNRGWSIKKMHRLLMTSKAYRMSSEFAPEANLARDADNLNWWRYRAQRLEAEAVRDSILFVSGSLNMKAGGPAVFPELPGEVLASMDKGIWRQQGDGPEVWRRSVYVYRKRGLPLPFFEVFDLPDQNITCGRRNVSTVPTQALTMLNNDWVLKQSRLFSGRIMREAPDGAKAQVDHAYRVAFGRLPDDRERAAAVEYVTKHSLEGLAHVLLNTSEFVYLR